MDEKITILIKYLCAFLLSFLMSLLINKLIIRIFKKYNLKQGERKYLDNHIVKEGTPSIGGLAIIISSLISFFLFIKLNTLDKRILSVLFSFISFGIVGFIDDYAKIKRKHEDGISGKKRLLIEGIIVLYSLVILDYNVIDFYKSEISIFNNLIFIGPLIIPLFMFLIVGCANSVNLSDGLDGLSSGLVVLASLPFLLISIKNNEISLSILLISVIGAILGFMVYNLHPARIFMGDTGSLSLGALLAIISIYLDKIDILPIAAFIFIFETISVIIQVLYYKKTKKRIFLMTPFHHHFEKKGVKEFRIVSYFWLTGFILAFISSLIGGLL